MKKQIIFPVLLIAFISFYSFSCKKEFTSQLPDQAVIPPVIKKEIRISNIEQLYIAVNDTGNSSCVIVLDPGTYVLSSTYPNSGRLELQTDMDMKGKKDSPGQVIIDQTALPTASFNLAGSGRTGGLRMGKGSNSIEWLTVIGNVNALSAIDTDLPSTETYVRIAHTVVRNSQIGIDVRNRQAEHAGRSIHASIENNDVFANTAGFGSGIVFQNANGATGSIITGITTGNYIHGNRVGFRAFNNAATSTVNNSSVTIVSNADVIEGNGLGMYINGGLTQVSSAFANGNQTHLEFYGSAIRNNNPQPMPSEILPVEANIPRGGIFVAGGNSTGSNNMASDNKLIAKFWGAVISGNTADINAYGAWSRAPATIPGINNLAEIYLDGVSAFAIVAATNCEPAEFAGTNVVRILR